jgi:hypothetical protein
VVIDRKMQIVLWFAGLRGAVSFALVERIGLYDSTTGEGTRLKPELKAMTSATIMFTVFVLGGYTYYVRYLHTLSKRDCFCFLYSVLCSAITDHQSLTLCSRVFFVFSTNR